jgi:transcriptional regulator with XRE-family HTH domain
MATKIGQKILDRRKELGLTQEELAFRVGYKTKSAINKIELGINDVSQSKVVKFAEALQTTPARLMGWEEEIKKNPVATAERHFEILMDEDFISMFDEFHRLDAKKRKIVKDLVHTLADTEV